MTSKVWNHGIAHLAFLMPNPYIDMYSSESSEWRLEDDGYLRRGKFI